MPTQLTHLSMPSLFNFRDLSPTFSFVSIPIPPASASLVTDIRCVSPLTSAFTSFLSYYAGHGGTHL